MLVVVHDVNKLEGRVLFLFYFTAYSRSQDYDSKKKKIFVFFRGDVNVKP